MKRPSFIEQLKIPQGILYHLRYSIVYVTIFFVTAVKDFELGTAMV